MYFQPHKGRYAVKLRFKTFLNIYSGHKSSCASIQLLTGSKYFTRIVIQRLVASRSKITSQMKNSIKSELFGEKLTVIFSCHTIISTFNDIPAIAQALNKPSSEKECVSNACRWKKVVFELCGKKAGVCINKLNWVCVCAVGQLHDD